MVVEGAPAGDPARVTPVARWCIGAIAAAAAVLVWVGTSRFGIGMESDSMAYVSVARGLGEGRGYYLYNGAPYLYYPPLYPALLALLAPLAGGVPEAARMLHALLMSAIAALTAVWISRLRVPRWGPCLAAAAVVIAVPLVDQWRLVTAELTFITLCVSSLLAMERHLLTGGTRWIVSSALLASLACLTRLPGLALLATGSALLLFASRGSWTSRIARVAMFGIAGAAPTAAWLARNVAVSGTLTGPRVAASRPLREVLLADLGVLGSWVLPQWLPPILLSLAGVMMLAAAAGLLSRLAMEARFGAATEAPDTRTLAIASASLFTLLYAALIVASQARTYLPSDPSRLLSPLYPAVVVLAAAALQEIGRMRAVVEHPRAAARIALALSIAILLWPARLTTATAQRLRRDGAGGYASERWQRSELGAWLRETAPAGRIYSNEPNALYAIAGNDSVFWLPGHGIPGTPADPDSALRTFARDSLRDVGEVHVIAFDGIFPEYSYTPEQLSHVFDLNVIARRAEGVVMRAAPRTPSPSAAPELMAEGAR
jgi:hypothetical protein